MAESIGAPSGLPGYGIAASKNGREGEEENELKVQQRREHEANGCAR